MIHNIGNSLSWNIIGTDCDKIAHGCAIKAYSSLYCLVKLATESVGMEESWCITSFTSCLNLKHTFQSSGKLSSIDNTLLQIQH